MIQLAGILKVDPLEKAANKKPADELFAPGQDYIEKFLNTTNEMLGTPWIRKTRKGWMITMQNLDEVSISTVNHQSDRPELMVVVYSDATPVYNKVFPTNGKAQLIKFADEIDVLIETYGT
jgi:hypothetical protein